MRRVGIRGKLLLPIIVFALVIGIGVVCYVQHLAREQAVQTALDDAQRLSSQLQEMREYYTKNVVAPASTHQLEVTHDYAHKPGALPLPATMIHELNDALNKKEDYSIRLYSRYPFPHRQQGGPRDSFEEEALAFLQNNPHSDFWKREAYQGREVVRYARADVMVSPTCVQCHNTHPSSPKTDWKLGDVRGALELIVPIDHALGVAQTGVRNIAVAIGLGLLGIVGIMAMLTQRLLFTPLRQLTAASTRIAVGDIDQTLDYRSDDEMGVLANAFRGLVSYIKGVAGAADALSRKDLTVTVIPQSDKDLLSQNFERAFASLKGMIGHIGESTTTLSAASEELSATATQLGANAEETSAQASVVSAAAEQVSKNVQTVATGTEEMSISIKEIAQQRPGGSRRGHRSRPRRRDHQQRGRQARRQQCRDRQGDQGHYLHRRADQPAGPQRHHRSRPRRRGGQGLCASWPMKSRSWPRRPPRPRKRSARRLPPFRPVHRGAVEAIAQIGSIIIRSTTYQSTIASAVEEQTATTNEISRNLSEAAKASADIAQNITGVAQAAQSTSGGATDSQRAAAELARMATELQRLVAQFRYERESNPGSAKSVGARGHDGAGLESPQDASLVWQRDRSRSNGRSPAGVVSV